MNFVSKLFQVGLCSVGLMLAAESSADAGFRHRHRHHGHCASACAPAPSCGACGTTAYSTPVATSGCANCQVGTTGVYAAPTPAPSGSTSPSDQPAGSPPPPPAPGPAADPAPK